MLGFGCYNERTIETGEVKYYTVIDRELTQKRFIFMKSGNGTLS
jgi:hypothetical protein